ncbi:hypothetical protein OROGR_008668 [Orobanche gracilis]
MQRLKKEKIKELLDTQNAAINGDMGKGRLKYLLQQTEIFAHFPNSGQSSQKKTKGKGYQEEEDQEYLKEEEAGLSGGGNTRLLVQPSCRSCLHIIMWLLQRRYREMWKEKMLLLLELHLILAGRIMSDFGIENQPFGLKPMNCPGHCLLFEHKVRSYRELPIRFAEFGVLHRNEASGALTGLTRVRRFQQVKDEVMGVLDFVNYVYGIFGFTFELKLSTRPGNYLGDLETWDKAETALSEALNEFGLPWQLNEGDGAFYGPKIDISVSDALKRKFQCATLQLDFQLPLRFNLLYSSEDEARRERPVMLHRAILGSVERMFAILLEHYKGKWPFWLSPRQVVVCTVSRKSEAYAVKGDKTVNKKVREAQLSQYNYILVVGEKDEDDKVVRVRDKNDHSPMTVEDLLKHFIEETEAFH